MKKVFLSLSIFFSALLIASCSNDDDRGGQSGITGTWRLSQIEDIQQEVHFPAEDDKPVEVHFKKDGTYTGVAGNNDIFGTYTLDGSILSLTMNVTEITGTDWELLFTSAIEQARSEDKYILSYELESTELIWKYVQSTMTFLRI